MEGLEVVPTIMSIVVVLAVLAVTLFALRWATSGKAGRVRRSRRDEPLVEIVERHSVGRNSALIVMRYGGAEHVLGVTDSSITALAEGTIDLRDPDPETEKAARKPRSTSALDHLRNKTVRR